MRRLLICLAILALPLSAVAQPEGVIDLLGDPQPVAEGYTVYSANGDTAWVNAQTGQWKAKVGETWYLSCPGTSSFQVAAVADSMEAMVRNDSVSMDPPLSMRLGCAINFDLALDTLLSWTPPQEPVDVVYANCETYVENDTVILPSGITDADTVAAITPRGECAGAVAVDDQPTALAVAGESDLIENRGMRVGEAIRLQVYDDGEEYVASPEWIDIDILNAAHGTYQEHGIHKVASLQ